MLEFCEEDFGTDAITVGIPDGFLSLASPSVTFGFTIEVEIEVAVTTADEILVLFLSASTD